MVECQYKDPRCATTDECYCYGEPKQVVIEQPRTLPRITWHDPVPADPLFGGTAGYRVEYTVPGLATLPPAVALEEVRAAMLRQYNAYFTTPAPERVFTNDQIDAMVDNHFTPAPTRDGEIEQEMEEIG